MTTLIIFNEEMKQNRTKRRFFSMSLGTLDACLLGNLLTGKGTVKAGEGTLEDARIFNTASSFN